MALRTRGFQPGGGSSFDLSAEFRELHARQQEDYEATRRPIRDYAA